MTSFPYKRSILAATIAALILSPAFGADLVYDVSSGPIQMSGVTFDNETISGSRSEETAVDDSTFFSQDRLTLTGKLLNDAEADMVGGRDSFGLQITNSNLGGGYQSTDASSWSVSGAGSFATLFNNDEFGQAGTEGSVIFDDHGTSYDFESGEDGGARTGALGIFGSTFHGDVVLDGFYGASGAFSRAIDIGDSLDQADQHTTIHGDLTLGEDAYVSGADSAPALAVTGVRMPSDTEDQATSDSYGYINIAGSVSGGADSAAVLIKDSQFKGLNVTGSIYNWSENGVGLQLDGNNLQVDQTVENGFYHSSITGDIEGTTAAIQILNDNTNKWYIDFTGILASNGDALLGSLPNGSVGSEEQVLNWGGGSIKGNIRDISRVDVYGNVVYTAGYTIGVPLTLTSGTSLTIEPSMDSNGNDQLSATVSGLFTMQTGSTLALYLGDSSYHSALLNLTGGAYFEPGTYLKLIPTTDDFNPGEGTTYTLITSNNAQGLQNLKLVSASALFYVTPSYSADGNTLTGTTSNGGDPEPADTRDIYHNLDSGPYSASADLLTLTTFGEHSGSDSGYAVDVSSSNFFNGVTNTGNYESSADGGFSHFADSTLGGVANSGNIQLNANSIGYLFEGSTVNGQFVNSGSITGGMGVSGSLDNFTDDIVNSGTINAIGDNSKGVYLGDWTSWKSVRNTGTLTATGQDSAGITIEGAGVGLPDHWDENGNLAGPEDFTPANTGIFNSGLISASGVGIQVLRLNEFSMPLVIHQTAGEIKGGTAAIQGAGVASLDWTGGAITGDVLGLSGATINGDAVFDGSTIESPTVNLNSGSLTLKGASTTIQGDLNAASGTLLKMSLSDATDPATALLNVTGTATFASNTGIQLAATPGSFSASTANTYTLLSAGNLVGGNNVAVTSSSALLEVSNYGAVGNTITAAVNTPTQTTPPVSGGTGDTGGAPDTGSNPSTGSGSDTGSNPSTGTGSDSGSNPSTGTGGDTGTNPSTGTGDGTGTGTTPPTDTGTGTGTTPPTDTGSGTVTIGLKSDDKIRSEVIAAGASSNDANALIPLAKNVMSKLNGNDPIFQALANAGTTKELAAISKQLKPEVAGGIRSSAIDQQLLVNDALAGRSAALRGGLSSGDEVAQHGVWVQALHTEATQDSHGTFDGYSAHSNGAVVGADGKINESLTAGVAFSTLNTDVGVQSGNSVTIRGQALTGYATFESGNWFADTSIMAGGNSNRSKRYVAGTLAKADYDSQLFGVNAVGGYRWKLNDQVLIEPRAGVRYSNLHIDRFKEKGSSASLDVESQRYERAEVGAGVRVAGNLQIGSGTLEPEVKVMAWHDVIGDVTKTTSTYVAGDQPFTTTGANPRLNTITSSVGANYKVGQWEIGMTYDRSDRSDYQANTVSARLRFNF